MFNCIPTLKGGPLTRAVQAEGCARFRPCRTSDVWPRVTHRKGPLEHFAKRQEASLVIATDEKIPSDNPDLGRRGQITGEVERSWRRRACPYSVPGLGSGRPRAGRCPPSSSGVSDGAGVSSGWNVRAGPWLDCVTNGGMGELPTTYQLCGRFPSCS